jgi:hypothetical protein
VQHNLRRSNQTVGQAEQMGQRKAYQQIAHQMTRKLRSSLGAGQEPGMRDSLKLIMQDAIDLALKQDSLEDGPAAAHKIERMLEMLESMDARGQGSGT